MSKIRGFDDREMCRNCGKPKILTETKVEQKKTEHKNSELK